MGEAARMDVTEALVPKMPFMVTSKLSNHGG
jgi:hypothetical protein